MYSISSHVWLREVADAKVLQSYSPLIHHVGEVSVHNFNHFYVIIHWWLKSKGLSFIKSKKERKLVTICKENQGYHRHQMRQNGSFHSCLGFLLPEEFYADRPYTLKFCWKHARVSPARKITHGVWHHQQLLNWLLWRVRHFQLTV